MRVVGLSLVLAVALASPLARADEPSAAPADDGLSTAVPRVHVVLVDGSEFTGELVEKVPQDHVTLKLEDGSLKRIDWEEIRFKHAPPHPPPPKVAAAPRSSSHDEAQIKLTADSNDAELQRKAGQTTVMTYMATPQGPIGQMSDADIWQTLCHAPCSVDADSSQVYRVGGDGIVGSSSFHLGAGSHTVSADTGSTLKRGFGWAFTVTGGIALFTGVVVLLITPRTLPDCTGGVCTNKDQSAAIYGLTLPIIGAGAVVLGLGLWMVLSSKTHVTVDGGAADDARLHLGPFQLSERGLAF